MREAFVLLGGWTRTELSYKEFVATAPKNTRIIFVEHKALGRKSPVSNLRTYVSKLRLTRFNLVGHSLGGAIAIDFATLYPESVSKLFLIDSEGIYGKEKFMRIFLNFFKTRIYHGRSLLFADLSSFYLILTNPFLHFSLERYAHFANFASELKTIKIPTVILWGEKDHITPLWQGQTMQKLIENSKLVVLPKMGHDWILHKGELFWKNI